MNRSELVNLNDNTSLLLSSTKLNLLFSKNLTLKRQSYTTSHLPNFLSLFSVEVAYHFTLFKQIVLFQCCVSPSCLSSGRCELMTQCIAAKSE